jgi:hypothetical protein
LKRIKDISKTTVNTAVSGHNDHFVIPLYPLNIDQLFSNVERLNDDRCQAFRVCNEYGSDAGTLSYLGKNEWRIYVDNFPGEKKYFSTNLPMNTVRDFLNDISRTGLKLIAV